MANEPYIDEPPDHRRARKMAAWGLGLALFPILTCGGCLAAVEAGRSEEAVWASLGVWALSCVFAFYGGVLGIRSGRLRPSGRAKAAAILGFAVPILSAIGGFAAGIAMIPFQRGRAFRRRGLPQLPEDVAGDQWRDAPRESLTVPAADRSAVAAGWRAMAATEAASIAAFASLAQQLLAVGAESLLVEWAHRDGLDEIAHARVCYEVAHSIDGRRRGAAPFPAAILPPDRAPTFRTLAEECLRESCVLEAASAHAAAALVAAPALDPGVREVLRTIAVDEARHAEHGWEMFRALAARAAEPVRTERILRELEESAPQALLDHDRYERFGLAGPTLWDAAVRRAIQEARERLELRAAA
tara:strand:+ start:985 stop:2058 length:1074 start_codon:yes stop_codon:yes gene_type:complete